MLAVQVTYCGGVPRLALPARRCPIPARRAQPLGSREVCQLVAVGRPSRCSRHAAMDLTAEALKGLALLGDKSKVPDAAFKATVIAACHSLAHPQEDTGLLGENAGGMTPDAFRTEVL